MAFLRNRGIALRLAAGFGVVLALMMAISAASLLQLRTLQQQADALVSQHIAMLDVLGRMQAGTAERSVLLRDLVLNDSLKVQREVTARLRINAENQAEISGRFSDFADTAASSSAREALHRIVELTERTGVIERSVVAKVADAHFDDAKALLASDLNPRHETLNRYLREAFVATMKDANASVERHRARDRWMLMLIAGATGFALLAGGGIAFLVARGVVRPVDEAKVATLTMASGDLTQPVAARSQDEVGQLVSALEWMRQALAFSVADIRRSAEHVRVGAREIEQGSADLASRTEEQAATLEESASSMEEFTATVQQNAQSAAQASTLARGTSDVARRGGEAVRGVVETMQGIHRASLRIADIIGVIDSIAFQTNILALNAAVEAARAGEQGRGFAVVAGEVRNLAQRSAAAAKEIKGLIQDATGRVDGGVQQVENAGRTMDEIVSSAQQVNALVAEIAHASAEQLAGIEQVNRAITQMDGNTQRNASVVQQAAEAARQMAEQAERLVEAVAKFRLVEGEPRQEPQPQPPRKPGLRLVEPEMLSLPAPLGAS